MFFRTHNRPDRDSALRGRRCSINAATTLVAVLLGTMGCISSAEAEGERACNAARAMEKSSSRRALEMMRRMSEEMPTAGTAAVARCLRPLKKRMGEVRTQVTMDRVGDPATLSECAWAADAMEVFSEVQHPPFRLHWARRLMERCAVSVGRAWTRAPDDPHLRALHERLVRCAKE